VTLSTSKSIKDVQEAAQHCASDTTPQPDQSQGGVDAVALQTARQHIATFAAANNRRAVCVVGLTFGLWLGLLTFGSWWFKQSAALSTWWGLALSGLWLVARMGSYVRAFVLTHDAVHNAVFTKRWANEWLAILSGMLTATDAQDYRRTHGQHHALLGIEVSEQWGASECSLLLQPQHIFIVQTCAAARWLHLHTLHRTV
jgi:fatty acid desaturase